MKLRRHHGLRMENSVNAEREAVRLKRKCDTLFSGVSRGLSRRMAMLKFAASNGERG